MKKLVLGALLCVAVGVHAVHADSWRVFFYLDSMEQFDDQMADNITELLATCPADAVEIYIQLNAYSATAFRYVLTNKQFVVVPEVALTGNSQQDLLDAAHWGFAGHTTDHTMLILNNFDSGVLGQDLAAALDRIREEVLRGNALDILVFNGGPMLEVAYHMALYTRYLVASQNCSSASSFDYKGVLTALNSQQNSPEAVAAGMVRAFDERDECLGKDPLDRIYAHTALDLSQAESVIQALNSLMVLVLALPDRISLLQAVRDQAPRFYLLPMYTDLVAFCDCVEQNLRASDSVDISRILYSAIYQAITNIRSAVTKMAVARCAGAVAHQNAHGCAIYCPPADSDSSYSKTLFAQSCKWYQALRVMGGQVEQAADSACVHAISF